MGVTRAQKLRLGIFLAAGITAMVVGLGVLAGMKLGEKKDSYSVRFSEASTSLSGLSVGSPVKYSGIRVGSVKSIRIDPKDVSTIVVQLELDGGTPVAENSVASLGSLGITGLKYVELSRGDRDARVRNPGEEIPAGPSLMDELSDQATAIAAKLSVLIERLNSFTTPEMKGKVAGVLDRSDRLLETTEATVSENRERLAELSQEFLETTRQVRALTTGLNGSVTRVNGLLDETRPRVVGVLSEAEELVSGLKASREKVDGLLVQSSGTLETAQQALGDEGLGRTLSNLDRLLSRSYLVLLQSQEDIAATTRYLMETAENMSVFSQRIKEDPSLLLLGTGEAEEMR